MVDALLSIPATRHIVIAGEMLELGPDAKILHANCGLRMAERGRVSASRGSGKCARNGGGCGFAGEGKSAVC